MFDDQQNNPAGAAPANLPMEPDDMFADIDTSPVVPEVPTALDAGVLKKAAPVRPTAPAPITPGVPRVQPAAAAPAEASSMSYTMREPILGKVILFLVLAAVLGGLGYGAWWAYNNIYLKGGLQNIMQTGEQAAPSVETTVPTSETTTPTPVVEPEIPAGTSTTSDITSEMNNDNILFGEPIDTDKDGLDDIREKELGTDPNNIDSDNDGLKDGDEVIIWRTNPLNPDTDGDSYLDGQEVKNGYSPLGPGKLNLIPQSTATATATGTEKITTSTTSTNQ